MSTIITQHNTLQHSATHCNTLQHTATHCNTQQHTATHSTFHVDQLTWDVYCQYYTSAYHTVVSHKWMSHAHDSFLWMNSYASCLIREFLDSCLTRVSHITHVHIFVSNCRCEWVMSRMRQSMHESWECVVGLQSQEWVMGMTHVSHESVISYTSTFLSAIAVVNASCHIWASHMHESWEWVLSLQSQEWVMAMSHRTSHRNESWAWLMSHTSQSYYTRLYIRLQVPLRVSHVMYATVTCTSHGNESIQRLFVSYDTHVMYTAS